MGRFPDDKALPKGSQELGSNPGCIFLTEGHLQSLIMETSSQYIHIFLAWFRSWWVWRKLQNTEAQGYIKLKLKGDSAATQKPIGFNIYL